MSVQLRVTATALQVGDAALVDRAGAPAMVTLGTAATAAASDFATAAQGADAREWTASTVDQAEAEAGTATMRRAWTAQRVRQAISAWWETIGAAALRAKAGLGTAATQDVGAFAAASHGHAAATAATAGFMAAADKSKLDGVAAGATVNATDAALRDRATHTGQQAMATVAGLESALAARAALATSVLVFDAGGNAAAARPTGAAVVMWTNVPSAPVNAQPRDLWFAAS